jgi:hypothetical protein
MVWKVQSTTGDKLSKKIHIFVYQDQLLAYNVQRSNTIIIPWAGIS